LTARLIAGSVDEAPRAFFRPAGSACRNGLLTGYRGTPAMDPDALEQLLLRVAQVAEDFPEVSELDLNPVVAVHDGVAALDVKLKLRPAEDEPDPYIRSLAVRRAHRPNH
jgi:hypothetical protein